MELGKVREELGLTIDETVRQVNELGVHIWPNKIRRLEDGDVLVGRDLLMLAGLSAVYRVRLWDLVPEDQQETATNILSMFEDPED